MPPECPLAINDVISWTVESGKTGAPGMAISTSVGNSWPGAPTVTQRKSPSSGNEASSRTSKPTFSVQNVTASSWSSTQTCAVLILIIAAPHGFSDPGGSVEEDATED